MKLWPTTVKNKYFVKMLWHLLGEYVKATLLLVCSSGNVATVATEIFFLFFFFSLPFVLFFLLNIYKNLHIYIVILTQQISQYFHNYWGVNFL